ncbi:MAG: hypothetical protein EOO39_00460 [Cytophagaceae bacterium]|nr:MAG: hypothetical protein EOO39_00460 [Cytophagaceae bacterium]
MTFTLKQYELSGQVAQHYGLGPAEMHDYPQAVDLIRRYYKEFRSTTELGKLIWQNFSHLDLGYPERVKHDFTELDKVVRKAAEEGNKIVVQVMSGEIADNSAAIDPERVHAIVEAAEKGACVNALDMPMIEDYYAAIDIDSDLAKRIRKLWPTMTLSVDSPGGKRKPIEVNEEHIDAILNNQELPSEADLNVVSDYYRKHGLTTEAGIRIYARFAGHDWIEAINLQCGHNDPPVSLPKQEYQEPIESYDIDQILDRFVRKTNSMSDGDYALLKRYYENASRSTPQGQRIYKLFRGAHWLMDIDKKREEALRKTDEAALFTEITVYEIAELIKGFSDGKDIGVGDIDRIIAYYQHYGRSTNLGEFMASTLKGFKWFDSIVVIDPIKSEATVYTDQYKTEESESGETVITFQGERISAIHDWVDISARGGDLSEYRFRVVQDYYRHIGQATELGQFIKRVFTNAVWIEEADSNRELNRQTGQAKEMPWSSIELGRIEAAVLDASEGKDINPIMYQKIRRYYSEVGRSTELGDLIAAAYKDYPWVADMDKTFTYSGGQVNWYSQKPLAGVSAYVDEYDPKPKRGVESPPANFAISPDALQSAEFGAIWELIKSWDISVPEWYVGNTTAQGEHVCAIMRAMGLVDEMGAMRTPKSKLLVSYDTLYSIANTLVNVIFKIKGVSKSLETDGISKTSDIIALHKSLDFLTDKASLLKYMIGIQQTTEDQIDRGKLSFMTEPEIAASDINVDRLTATSIYADGKSKEFIEKKQESIKQQLTNKTMNTSGPAWNNDALLKEARHILQLGRFPNESSIGTLRAFCVSGLGSILERHAALEMIGGYFSSDGMRPMTTEDPRVGYRQELSDVHFQAADSEYPNGTPVNVVGFFQIEGAMAQNNARLRKALASLLGFQSKVSIKGIQLGEELPENSEPLPPTSNERMMYRLEEEAKMLIRLDQLAKDLEYLIS